jgi:hypothetical protein
MREYINFPIGFWVVRPNSHSLLLSMIKGVTRDPESNVGWC